MAERRQQTEGARLCANSGGAGFGMPLIGLRLGGLIGERVGKWAEFLGGVGLAAIGLNSFVTHTMM